MSHTSELKQRETFYAANGIGRGEILQKTEKSFCHCVNGHIDKIIMHICALSENIR